MKGSFYEEIETTQSTPSASHDYNAKIGQEKILQSTIRNESIHPKGNDNGIRLVKVKYIIIKYLIIKRMQNFLHHNTNILGHCQMVSHAVR